LKIIFSRKGIDDAYGKGASPIMPDGQMISLPIPVKRNEKGRPYASLMHGKTTYKKLIKKLKINIKESSCHHDPDLSRNNHQAPGNWLPAFGQRAGAASHLINQKVNVGDLFLFFGSFRHTNISSHGELAFAKNSRKRHVIFGYLKVGYVLDLNSSSGRQKTVEIGQAGHAHMLNLYSGQNILYAAKNENDAGTFSYHDDLVLSKMACSKSIWRLPKMFNEVSISRHTDRKRFQLEADSVTLRTVSIGQDFVVEENDKVTNWAHGLISNAQRHHQFESNNLRKVSVTNNVLL